MMGRDGILIASLLALAVLAAEGAGAQGTPGATPPGRAAAAASDPLPVFPSLQDLKATRERPLFVPSRRPPSAPPPPEVEEVAVEAEPAEAPFELAGIIMGDEVAIAVLRNKSNQETQNVRRGQTVENWTLAEIQSQSVLLRRGGTRVRLKLFEEDKDKAGKSSARTPRSEDDEDIDVIAPTGPSRISVKRVDENGNVVKEPERAEKDDGGDEQAMSEPAQEEASEEVSSTDEGAEADSAEQGDGGDSDDTASASAKPPTILNR